MSIDTSKGHPAMDYREHERTWAGVVRGTKIMVGLVVALLILIAIITL